MRRLDQACKCDAEPSVEPHSCPYQSEINDDDNPEYCHCCEYCAQECAWDI